MCRTPTLIRSFSSEYTKRTFFNTLVIKIEFLMPSAKRLVALNHLDASKILGTGLGGRIMGYDVERYMEDLKSGKKMNKVVTTPKSVVSGTSTLAVISK